MEFFLREFEMPSLNISLQLHQNLIGDVGCVVWDAALVLAGYLEARGESLIHKRAIELGAGTGCVGLAAAALGANAIVTDLPECIDLLQRNIQANQSVLKGSIEAAPLIWGTEGHDFLKKGHIDLILVADCIYYDQSLDPLIKTICDLSAESTEVLICYEERNTDAKRLLLKDFLAKVGTFFNITSVSHDSYRSDLMCDDIHILRLMKHNKEKS